MTKYHISKKGNPEVCKAEISCRLKGDHYETAAEATKAYEEINKDEQVTTHSKSKLVEKHGVLVKDGEIAIGAFIQSFNKKDSAESHYDGSWDDLQKLVKTHWENNEPGIGSVDGDVLLINVPSDGFYTPIVEITDENKHLIVEEDYVRQPGEKPVKRKTLPGVEKSPAKYTKIVVYRADTLARDDSRSTQAEWEIIAILAQDAPHVPMDPETMKRNSNHDEGGTYREYTPEEWAEAYAYWDTHVKVSPK